MFLLLWTLFIILNGRLDAETALLGIAVSALVFLFMCCYAGWTPEREWHLYKTVPQLLLYVPRLFAWILAANLATVRQILRPGKPRSAVVTIHPALSRRWQMQLLANSITLTPGTVSMECTEDTITVHCLDESMAEGLADSSMERAIRKMGAEK